MNFLNKLTYVLVLTALCIFIYPSGIYAYLDYPYAVVFQTIHTPLMPLGDENPEEHQFALRMNLRWINVWSIQRSRFIIDGEEVQLEPYLRFAITDSLQVGMAFPFVEQGGGVMDEYIEIFHRSVGVTQGGRESFPRNKFNVSYEHYGYYYPYMDSGLITRLRAYDYRTYPRKPYDSPVPLRETLWAPLPSPQIDPELKAIAEGDVVGYYTNTREFRREFPDYTTEPEYIPASDRDLSGAGDPRFNLQKTFHVTGFLDRIITGIQVKIPSNEGTFISAPGTDAGIFLTASKKAFADSFGYSAGISYTSFSNRRFNTIRLAPEQWVLRLGGEFYVSNWKLIQEYVYFTRPVLKYGELTREGHQFSFGVERNFDGFRMTLAAIENFKNYGVTPDIGFLMSMERML